MDIRDGYLTGVVKDDFDVERVVVYRVKDDFDVERVVVCRVHDGST